MTDQEREVMRRPVPPRMDANLIHLLTDLCFQFDTPANAELIFVFGSNIMHAQVANIIEDLISKAFSNTIVISGGIANYTESIITPIAESEIIFSHLSDRCKNNTSIFLEKQSRNTIENLKYSSQIIDLNNHDSIIFISHSYASVRSKLSLSKFYPKSKLISRPMDIIDSENKSITKTNWQDSILGRSLVWGEYLRFLTYGQRGDFPIETINFLLDEIKNKVNCSNL